MASSPIRTTLLLSSATQARKSWGKSTTLAGPSPACSALSVHSSSTAVSRLSSLVLWRHLSRAARRAVQEVEPRAGRRATKTWWEREAQWRQWALQAHFSASAHQRSRRSVSK